MDNHKKRILIIEADGEMRSFLKDFLEDEGYEVDSASYGPDRFCKLVRQSFNLIITDIWMPGLKGLDILPGVKKLQPQAAILVITSYGNHKFFRKAFERGASAYLVKPIHLYTLRTVTHQLIYSTETV